MAGAFTAVPGGSEAACANPATLVELASPEVTAAYGRLYSGLSDDSSIGQGYFGFAFPVKRYLRGNAALSWSDTRLSEAYSESYYAVSYATSVYRGIGAGVTLKYMRRGYTSDSYTALDPVFTGGYSKSALGADLGFFYRPRPAYALGLALRNINKPDLGLDAADPQPVEVRAGASYQVRSSLIDLDAAFAGPDYTISAGAEHVFQRRYALRMGLSTGNDSRRSVNLGVGGRFGLAAFDYSFSLPISGIAGTVGSHRLAFSFRFGAEAAAAEELAAAADLRRAQDKAALQEEKIRALQERLDAVTRAAAAAPQPAPAPAAAPAQPAQQPVVIIQPSPADAQVQAEIARQIEALKLELQKSRAEMESLKARPAAAKPAPQAKPAPARRNTYTVKEGDTLGSIAEEVYGDAGRWMEIYRANAGSLGRGGEVKPGQVLALP